MPGTQKHSYEQKVRLDAPAFAPLAHALIFDMRYTLRVNDGQQLSLMKRVAEQGETYRASSDAEALRAQMLMYQMSPTATQGYGTFVSALAGEPHVLEELG